MVEDENTPLRVVPTEELYSELEGEARDRLMRDVCEVYTRVTGREPDFSAPKKEYEL